MPVFAQASKPVPGVTLYFSANQSGAMLAVPIPHDVAARIALPGGEAPEDLHITLFYFGDAENVAPEGRDAIIYTALGVAASCVPFEVTLEGTEVFEENEERPIVALVNSPALVAFREKLAGAFYEADIDYSKDYEYKPHVTLKYLGQEPAPPVPVHESFTATEIEAYFAKERYSLSLFQRHSYARKPAGQAQRQGAGAYEGLANRQQRALVRAYDVWAARVKKELLSASEKGVEKRDLVGLMSSRLPALEEELSRLTAEGVSKAARLAVGERHVKEAVVQDTVAEEKAANRQAVTESLIPNLEAHLAAAIMGVTAITAISLRDAFNGSRVLPAQYAGGAWVAIFRVQQEAGKERERERAGEGLEVEPVRWVLDPNAEHCTNSTGDLGAYYGCPDLEGEYPGGWNTLPTVPAGRVTCRGNCRCNLEVYRNGAWRRGIFDD